MTRLTDLNFTRLEKLSIYSDRFTSLRRDLQDDGEITLKPKSYFKLKKNRRRFSVKIFIRRSFMNVDRYSSQGLPHSISQTAKEEMNRQVASLTNENIYEFLRRHFDNSRTDELEDINPVYLLQEDPFGQTMLHWAAVKGDVEITKFIIKKTGNELFNSRTK